jgi:RecA-family ATPase
MSRQRVSAGCGVGTLPAGKLVVLDGDPSVGKSTLAIDRAVRLSVGAAWPDGTGCPLGDVLVLSAEDGLADTIRPRLDAAGGDPARVHALTDVTFRGTYERAPSRCCSEPSIRCGHET